MRSAAERARIMPKPGSQWKSCVLTRSVLRAKVRDLSKESRMRTTVLALLATCSLSACASAGGPWVELAGHRYTVEIADDDAERARGLMYREAMEADRGMLFIDDAEQPQAYWMKNTKIPLDILYFDDARKLVSQQRDVPPCSLGDRCPSYPSNAPARYILELNAGQAAKLKLEDGAELRFGPGIPPAK